MFFIFFIFLVNWLVCLWEGVSFSTEYGGRVHKET